MIKKLILGLEIIFILLSLSSCLNEEFEKEILIETGTVTDLACEAAKIEGVIIDFGEGIDEYGHCWSKGEALTIQDSVSVVIENFKGQYTSYLKHLEDGTKYYYRSYAKKGDKIVYGEIKSFTTIILQLPEISYELISCDSTSIELLLNIIDFGGSASLIDCGVVYSEDSDLELNESEISLGNIDTIGSYKIKITDLKKNTLYNIRLYAENEKGRVYSGLIITYTNTILVTEGLIAYYPFDGDANDYSGNENNATNYGATLTTDRFGNANAAYNFNGIDNYLVTNTKIDNYLGASASFVAWINIAQVGDYGRILSNYNGTGAPGDCVERILP